MPHLQIHTGPDQHGTTQVLVDGHDISKHIYAEGFAVHFPTDFDEPPVVILHVPADVLDIDLPDAVLTAIRMTDEQIVAARREMKR